MRKVMLSMSAILCLNTTQVNAFDLWTTTKVYANKAMFWKNEHLEDIDFKHIYPKAFYKKSYFGFLITGVAVIGAGAFTYVTAGAGAPAAATGVSSVASFIAGGGAGSYMAGLSVVGGWVGGNAMVGAAILNGISIGMFGSSLAGLSVLGKLSILSSVTASGLDGVAFFSNPETKELEYRIRLQIPKDLGSKATREIVDKIYDVDSDMQDAINDNDSIKQNLLIQAKQAYFKKAIDLLKNRLLESKNNQEDMIVLGIIAYNQMEIELFSQALNKININDLDNSGFLNYLYALQSLSNGENEAIVLNYLDNSIAENPYALEPYILYINLLGNKDFIRYVSRVESLVKKAEDNFDSDDYSTGLSMVSLYYRVATFYFQHQRFVEAQHYYEKALDNIGFLQKHFFGKDLKHTIQLSIANSLYAQYKRKKADEVYNDILSDIDEDNTKELQRIKTHYLGNN